MKYFVNPVFDRILRDDASRMPYRRREGTVKTINHWGQRKLLISEIEFLTLIGRHNLEGAHVVYAGAAPGTHIFYLSKLFPEVHFILVDPAPFHDSYKKKRWENITIIEECFTDAMATELAHRCSNIYLISDIRTSNHKVQSDSEVERRISQDMACQMRWHEMLGSKRSMLKFRLPWESDAPTEYLDGDIYLPVWGPQTTTECRLITKADDPRARKMYDNKKYEEQMMFFNNVMRHSLYSHNVEGEGLDHCYDCTAEIYILKQYLYSKGCSADRIQKEVARMSMEISRNMMVKRTLLDDPPDPETRVRNIHNRQHRHGIPEYETDGEVQSWLVSAEALVQRLDKYS